MPQNSLFCKQAGCTGYDRAKLQGRLTEVTTHESWGSGKKDEPLRGAFISRAELSGPQGSWGLLTYISPGVGGPAPACCLPFIVLGTHLW